MERSRKRRRHTRLSNERSQNQPTPRTQNETPQAPRHIPGFVYDHERKKSEIEFLSLFWLNLVRLGISQFQSLGIQWGFPLSQQKPPILQLWTRNPGQSSAPSLTPCVQNFDLFIFL
eukprot:c19741_g1_i4.p1 GENE.c19741_g1_i4~~c19741_g1_i4.p1  ORF type:complete len:117 (-),score=6.75 c19741_g1_i4:29-379(-)